MAIKLIMTQAGQAFAVELADGQYVIGREQGASIIIPDPSISSRHADILVKGNLVQIRDLGSSNGTWINGHRVQGSGWRLVGDTDALRVGVVDLAIELTGEAASKPPVFVGAVVNDPGQEEEASPIPSFLTFRGRLGRFEFWISMILLTPPVVFLQRALARGKQEPVAGHIVPMLPMPKMLAIVFLSLVILWFMLCATAKRWHDRDKSAWWLMLWIGPVAIQIWCIAQFGLKSTPAVIMAAVTALAGTWNFVELGLMGGTIGRNRYGG